MTKEVQEALFAVAVESAAQLQQHKASLEKHKASLEVELAQVTGQLGFLDSVPQRLKDFKALFKSHEAWCPSCWVKDGNAVTLRPIDGTDHEDLFRCRSCGREFSVPI